MAIKQVALHPQKQNVGVSFNEVILGNRRASFAENELLVTLDDNQM
jgi:hypothetical protein